MSNDKLPDSYFVPTTVKATIRMKCKNCGKWNNVAVQKVMLHLDNEEPKAEIFLPAYLPLKPQVCVKCKNPIADPKELIRIKKP
jgi:hypothetical protein